MKELIIAIGADHRGFAQKEFIKKHLQPKHAWIIWLDQGAYNDERSDYPIFAKKVAKVVQEGQAAAGVLLCGTGIGMAIAANRYHNIYAGLIWNEETARLSKEHDKVNILVLPSDYITNQEAVLFTTVWLEAHFKGGRYQERIALIDS